MNARTSRLLRRMAHVMYVFNASQVRESEPQILAGLKKRWHATPRPERGVFRVGIVNAVAAIVKGAQQAEAARA